MTLVILASIGFFALSISGRGSILRDAATLAIPIGLVFWQSSALLLLALGMPLSVFAIAIVSASAVTLLRLVLIRTVQVDERLWGPRTSPRHLLLDLTVNLAVAATATLFPFALISNDSLILSYMGFLLSSDAGFHPDLSQWYTWGWPIMLPLTSALNDHQDFGYFSPAPLAASLSLTVALLFRAQHRLRHVGAPAANATAIAIAITVFTFSSEISLYNYFYQNHHSLAACFLFLFALCVFDGIPDQRGTNEICLLAAVSLVGLSFSRHEGPFISLILLLLFAERFRNQPNIIFATATLTAIPTCAYLSFLLFHGTVSPGTVLNDRIIIAMMLGYLAFGVLSFALMRRQCLTRALKFSAPMVGLIFLLLHIAGYFKNGAVYWESMSALFSNLFLGSGAWGIAWPVYCVLFILSLALAKRATSLHKLIAYFSLMILTMPAIRDMPFREGLGDSANRMFLHVSPIFSLLLLEIICWLFHAMSAKTLPRALAPSNDFQLMSQQDRQ